MKLDRHAHNAIERMIRAHRHAEQANVEHSAARAAIGQALPPEFEPFLVRDPERPGKCWRIERYAGVVTLEEADVPELLEREADPTPQPRPTPPRAPLPVDAKPQKQSQEKPEKTESG